MALFTSGSANVRDPFLSTHLPGAWTKFVLVFLQIQAHHYSSYFTDGNITVVYTIAALTVLFGTGQHNTLLIHLALIDHFSSVDKSVCELS